MNVGSSSPGLRSGHETTLPCHSRPEDVPAGWGAGLGGRSPEWCCGLPADPQPNVKRGQRTCSQAGCVRSPVHPSLLLPEPL